MFASRKKKKKKDYYLDYENSCCSHGTKKDEFFILKTRTRMKKGGRAEKSLRERSNL